MMTSRAHLLVASWDEMLLRTRSLMLGTYFSVQPAGRFSEAIHHVRQTRYDLLVLCHTLSNEQQEFLAAAAREVSLLVSVLALYSAGADYDRPYADCTFDVRRGPYRLVQRCAQLVGFTIRTKVKHFVRAS